MMLAFTILVLCILALLGVAAAVFFLARKHMRKKVSDTMMVSSYHEEQPKTGMEH